MWMNDFYNKIPYDILNELGFYINTKNKIKLEKTSKKEYIKKLIYIYIISNSKKLTDKILKQNTNIKC